MPPPATAARLGPIPRLALVVFFLISTGVSGRQTLWYFSHGPTVTDFRIFMTGIDMMRSGEGHDLYHFDAQQRVQTRLYPETKGSGLIPFNHLAFELLYYWPISRLPYHSALIAWAMINVVFVFLIGWLLAPYTQALRHTAGVPLALYLLAFYPVIFAMGQGQDSLVFFLLLVLSLRALDTDRTFLAGFILALASFKFHLALLILFFVFFLPGKWRGLAGFAAGGVVVGGISLAMVGPHLIPEYLAMLRNQGVMTPWGFIPWYMPNLRGLLEWGLAPQLDLGSILPVIFMASAVVGVVATWLTLRSRAQQDPSLAYAVAILTTVLLSYHLHMQDLAMAALPMLVLLDRMIRERTMRPETAGAATTHRTFSPTWTASMVLAVASLYLFRIAGEPFPVLQIRGCLLAVPVFLLWMVALHAWCSIRSTVRVAA
ncbi:MAG: DUF2029 domain-containing protein [Acidobacteriia bacterium]|nr:DUF2029 domain-containing protein [Terriglobia bacterium]